MGNTKLNNFGIHIFYLEPYDIHKHMWNLIEVAKPIKSRPNYTKFQPKWNKKRK